MGSGFSGQLSTGQRRKSEFTLTIGFNNANMSQIPQKYQRVYMEQKVQLIESKYKFAPRGADSGLLTCMCSSSGENVGFILFSLCSMNFGLLS